MPAAKRVLLALRESEPGDAVPELPQNPADAVSDTDAELACPHCGSLDVNVAAAKAAEVDHGGVDPAAVDVEGSAAVDAEGSFTFETAVCLDCGAEFPMVPVPEDTAAMVVADVVEQREQRLRCAERIGVPLSSKILEALIR